MLICKWTSIIPYTNETMHITIPFNQLIVKRNKHGRYMLTFSDPYRKLTRFKSYRWIPTTLLIVVQLHFCCFIRNNKWIICMAYSDVCKRNTCITKSATPCMCKCSCRSVPPVSSIRIFRPGATYLQLLVLNVAGVRRYLF